MGNISMNDPISLKALPWFAKIIAAIVGAIFALVLSGDIDKDGRVQISTGLIIKLAFSVSFSLMGGQAFIDYFELEAKSVMTHGFIMLMCAVFGMLIVGIVYQSMALLRGKSLSEIITEVKTAFAAIFGGK